MSKTNLSFNDTEVKKGAFYNSKYPININKVDIEKTVISDKISYGMKGFKYYICYKNDEKIKQLFIMFPKMSGYVK